MAYKYKPHPHISKRKLHSFEYKLDGVNKKLAVKITDIVGSMWCAYAFAGLALISLPSSIMSGTTAIISWIAQTFLQLVLLSIIMVGQKVESQKNKKREEEMYHDVTVIYEEMNELHKHLEHIEDLKK